MRNRKFVSLLGVALVAMLVLGGVSAAVAKPKRAPKPDLAAKAVAQHVSTGSLVRNLATLADVSPSEINAQRRLGRSLSSIATSYSVEPTAVVDMTLAKLKARLTWLAKKKKCSKAKAHKLVAKAEARLWRLMNAVPPCIVPAPSTPPTACPDPCTPPTGCPDPGTEPTSCPRPGKPGWGFGKG
ncbi:MAG: hypothetical protein HY876_05745 [Coriobacteriales bacterium]|nr:hypothetical protein [Coriobacteriales bacterium]